MKRLRFLSVPLAGLLTTPLLVSLATAPASASAASTASDMPVLVDVRAAHHPGFDRVVFEFAGDLPYDTDVRWVRKVIQDGSGKVARVAGRRLLQVRFEGVDAHDSDGNPTVPGRTAHALPNVITTVLAGDFEGVVTYGVGLAKKTSYEVSTLSDPSRVVLDIRAKFDTEWRKVYFVDAENYADGDKPYLRSVLRRVRPSAPATAVLDRLFAGPTRAEKRDGLRLVRSKARSFADLQISANGVARVRLTGGCSSGGSTLTVADEIRRTLKQFSTVDWVKIYDPAGRTQTPKGRSDSIPECLEP